MKRFARPVIGFLSILWMLSLGSFAGLHAQTMRVEGTVHDLETGEAIETAQVHVQGRLQGVLTDANGHFSLEMEGPAKAVEVSHVGYQKAIVPLKAVAVQRLQVRLEVAAQLDAVEITAGPSLVLEDKTIHLYDYEFFEGQLMMIVYDRKQRRSQLALVDAHDSIIDLEIGAEEPGKLKRDCLGNIHAITSHYACQLFLDSNQIGYFVDSLATFERVVEPCLGNIGAHYYFEYRRFNNQILDYFAYNMQSEEWTPFLQVQDKNKMHQIMDPLGIYMSVATSEQQMMALTPADWKKIGTLDPEFQFQQMAFFYPVHAPLRVIDGHVYVFDHLNGLLRKFAPDGKALEEVGISYHHLPHWERSIIVDEVRGTAYTLYEKQGFTSLRKIDLATGDAGEAVEIPRQFAKKIMVHDGVAYFMYQEGESDDTNRLYRMPL